MNFTIKKLSLLLLSLYLTSSISAQVSFSDFLEIETGQYGTTIAIADMNNDGRNDLVVVGTGIYSVRIFYQNEAHELAGPPKIISYPDDHGDRGISIADLDGNGWLDFIISSDDLFSIFYQESDGEFNLEPYSNSGFSYYSSAYDIGDLNNDGLLDIVYARGGADYFFIAYQQADHSFVEQEYLDFYEVNRANSLIITDVDGDGLNDLVTGGRIDLVAAPIVAIFFQDPISGISNISAASIAIHGRTLAVGDINNDGIKDLVTTDNALVLNSTLDGFETTFNFSGINGASANMSVQLSDLNCDGYLDIVTTRKSVFDAFIYEGSSTGFLPEELLYLDNGHTGIHGLAVGDINSDNMPDILRGRSIHDNGVTYALNTLMPDPESYVTVDTSYRISSISDTFHFTRWILDTRVDTLEECVTETFVDSFLISGVIVQNGDSVFSVIYKEAIICNTTVVDSIVNIPEFNFSEGSSMFDTVLYSQSSYVEMPCSPAVEPHGAQIHLYPNPTKDLVYVPLPNVLEEQSFYVEIYDAVGKKVYERISDESINEEVLELDLSSFASGVYMIVLKGEESCYGKVVLARAD
jgi:hypothetical protein